MPRKPGMSRDDLLGINAKIVGTVADNIKAHAPKAFVIVLTNPLDAMVTLMKQRTGFPKRQVIGIDLPASGLQARGSARPDEPGDLSWS